MLGALHRDWAPAALAVSFKLETDEQLLVDKVRRCCVQGLGFSAESFTVQQGKCWRSLSSWIPMSSCWWTRRGDFGRWNPKP
jgi:hypothetical protein